MLRGGIGWCTCVTQLSHNTNSRYTFDDEGDDRTQFGYKCDVKRKMSYQMDEAPW